MRGILLFILFMVIAAGFTGFYLGLHYDQETQTFDFPITALRTGETGLINPLLEYEIGSKYYMHHLILFKKPIEDVINEKIAKGDATQVAVYYRELIGGPWLGIHEDDKFFPASLLKLPIMVSYYKQAESDPSILKKKITFDKDVYNSLGDFNTGEHFPSVKKIQKDKEYTVEELIRYMIVYSDNNAKNLLIFNLGDPNNLFSVYKDLGFDAPPELNSSQEVLSVHQYASFFRVLYNASYLNKTDSEKALELLTQSTFNAGLREGVPSNIRIAHKFGEYTNNDIKQLHDCGIIYYPSDPYILCIMSRGKDFDKLSSVIKDISQTVYKEINSHEKK